MPAMRRALALSLALSLPPAAGAASPSAAPERNLAETIERFETLVTGDRSAPVKELRLSCGHLELVLESASVAPVRAGDQVVGLFFQGSGTLVVGLLQFLTKKDYNPFFEANYWGTGLPAY